ncbi:MAG: MFS transporter [Acidobacteriota bacterium]|nr:MFS transporter [Acidobacteriota bacterium]
MTDASPSTATRFSLISLLYVSQSVPLGFFIVAVPAILRDQGLSLEYVGLLSVIAFPWLVKFAWAPVLDQYGSRERGHYRSWILPLQTLSVLCVTAIAWLDLSTQILWLAAIGAIFMLLSATQDVATDGLAVRTLLASERGIGNGIQVGGYYLGQVLGGGAVLVAFQRYGWTTAVLAMAAVLALPLVPALRFRETPIEHDCDARVDEPRKVDFGSIKRFVNRDTSRVWLVVLLLYRAAETMAVTMVTPMLVDFGLSLVRIGLLMGVAGSVASFAGALLGGAFVQRLGRKTSLLTFGAAQCIAIAALSVAVLLRPELAFVYPPILAIAFAGGMSTAALYTSMMDRSSQETAATDFTVQQSLCAIGPLVASSLSGFSAALLGFGGHYGACVVVNVVCLVVIARWLAREAPTSDGLAVAMVTGAGR